MRSIKKTKAVRSNLLINRIALKVTLSGQRARVKKLTEQPKVNIMFGKYSYHNICILTIGLHEYICTHVCGSSESLCCRV